MKRFIFVLLTLWCGTAFLGAQENSYWENFPGPYGGEFEKVFFTNAGLVYGYPAQSDGVVAQTKSIQLYRSADQGAHWTKLDLTLNGDTLKSRIFVGQSGHFYALKYHSPSIELDNSLYRSTDEGATWELVTDQFDIYDFFETPGGAIVVTTTYPFVFHRSTDNGQSWQTFNPPSSYIYDELIFMPNGVLAMQNDKYLCLGIFSKDDGQTWTELLLTESTVPRELLITPSGAILRYLYTGLQRSADNGQTWQNITAPGSSGNQFLSFTTTDSGRILLYRFFETFYSDDDGLSWQPLSTNHYVDGYISRKEHNGYLYGYGNDALYRSADGGQSWEFSADGMRLARVHQLEFVSKDTFFALTRNGLWRTDNNGQQWTKITDTHKTSYYFPSSVDAPYADLALTKGHELWVKANDTLWRSDDLGAHLTYVPSVVPDLSVKYCRGVFDSVVFGSLGAQVNRSTDDGQSWQPIPGVREIYRPGLHPSGRMYAILKLNNNTTSFQYSDDLGLSWAPVNGSWNATSYPELFISKSGTIYVVIENTPGRWLVRSLDNGLTWGARPFSLSGSFSENALGHLFLNHQYYYYRSLDEGIVWSKIENPQDYSDGILHPVSPDQYLFTYRDVDGMRRSRIPTVQGAYVGGHVLADADADCSTPDAQIPLYNWTVEANGTYKYYTSTDSSGRYLMFVDTGAYAVSARVPNAVWWESCTGTQTTQIDSLLGADTLDFAMRALSECPLLAVDLGIPRMRRCFDNPIYVNYCNQGSETADSAWVMVFLDPFVDMVSATLPAEDLGNNSYRFQVGNLPTGACGAFSVVVHVQCNTTVLGQTHCFSAHGYPDTLCTEVPNWSGAAIQARIECQDTTLEMKLKNVGTAPSQTLDYIIIVDDVVFMDGSQSYNPGQEMTLTRPADGHTWRVESEQEPGHPFATNDHIALAFAEGCGGYNSLGFINQFPVDEFISSWDRDCIENTGAYDPNDKQGFPLGTTEDHLIRPGQELEYLVRFQNTGTDTAFTVVVRDTLSPWLNPAAVRPGAASHPYTWNLSGQGVLSFTFSNILLPDSNVNEAASHGFISFRIAQQPDLPLGAVIYNEADIYFDFNEAIVTNQTWHTIGVPATIGVAPAPSKLSPSEILVSPQPVGSYTVLRRSDGRPFGRHRLYLLDALGHTVRSAELNGAQYRFEREALPAGLYFYRIESADGRPAGAGSLVLQP